MVDFYADKESKMDKINIHSSLYDYEVEFVDDFEKKLQTFEGNITYVIDKNVFDLYQQRFSGINMQHVYLMDVVEDKKNMETVMEIITFWQQIGVRKNWKVICFGGGITQDVTTVASNLFLRNIDWYFFPTTLLSMCDSCIGGKCGINFGAYKNQIGVFYPPKKIFIDSTFLQTLSNADYLNGWGELLKFSLTDGLDFYQELKQVKQYIPCDNIDYYIHKGLFVKKIIIEEDEFESDLRRVLNYGHTFGHALEAYTHHGVPHGTAVIWGIDVVNYLAYKESLITQDFYLDVKEVIKKCFLTSEVIVENPLELFEIIKTDKKVKDSVMNFAMLDAPAHLIVYPMNIDEKLKTLFLNYIEETHEYYSN